MKTLLLIVFSWQIFKVLIAPLMIGKEKSVEKYDYEWYLWKVLESVTIGLICLAGLGVIKI